MAYTIKPFDDLDIMDDFLMNAVASNEEVGEEFCRTLLTVLLQRDLGKIHVNVQRIIPANIPTQRGIRMDVEVAEYGEENEDTYLKNIYDVEPNRNKAMNLPKHNRFYQAKIDSRNMKSGENDFLKLPNLFVITITNYDPFGYDHMMYTIQNRCVEISDMDYDDGLTFIYFNTTGTKGGNSSIKKLLNFIQDSKIYNVTDEATKKLHDYISKVKFISEVRSSYMTLEEKIFYERIDAKNEGKIEGKIEDIFELLEEMGVVSDELREKISKDINLEQIKKWHKLAAKADSIEEFIEKM